MSSGEGREGIGRKPCFLGVRSIGTDRMRNPMTKAGRIAFDKGRFNYRLEFLEGELHLSAP